MARNLVQATIAVSGTVSTIANGKGLRLAGFYTDSNLTGTTIKLIASGPNADVAPGPASGQVYNSGSQLSYTVGTCVFTPIAVDIGSGIDCVQAVSGASQSTNPSIITFVFV